MGGGVRLFIRGFEWRFLRGWVYVYIQERDEHVTCRIRYAYGYVHDVYVSFLRGCSKHVARVRV